MHPYSHRPHNRHDKNLPPERFNLLSILIRDFWITKDTNFESWHATKLSNLFKGIGDQQDPNNWWGICFKETTTAKLWASSSPGLKKIESPSQFGHAGCQEALHSLRSVLKIWRHHSLKSYSLFVDLVKAFDSFQHEVLYVVLKKYGIPSSLMNVINKNVAKLSHTSKNWREPGENTKQNGSKTRG